jgi:hypothetical protein
MIYKEIESESMSGIQKHIIIDNEDGSFKSFPVDKSNPEYVAFLEATVVPAKASKAKAVVEPQVSDSE